MILINALWDSNVPKFLKHDLPLFETLIQDLFPEMQKRVESSSETLVEEVVELMEEINLFSVEAFV